ncbi:UDP-N-acetylglucosamine acyltransferase [Nocardioides gansuensis]|uniref:UDP-N-acetylglucosamine acyltransferase n=1 Tax=Nocardioides gansuensis TaxID=2138300 RepID=A0A2T8F6M5_9ACTN|nr:UDP-N-acetylglucosamine acyltransferase [Nocardioides gansuensis]PVG81368.1 UDP-N-acetylglucosamine acyltransferase [Nocardioides gansuensis]
MSNRIHPTAVLGPQVELGEDNVIGPFCVLQGPVVLGDSNFLASHVSIGGAAEVRGHRFEPSWEDDYDGQGVRIGSRNVFKEFVAVNGGWAHTTTVGDDGFFMGKVHLNHDVTVGHEVTISGAAVAAGHVTIEDGANLGLGTTVHQRRTVPAGSMIGMQSAVTRDLPPYVVSMGVPARPARLNTHRLDRLGVSPDHHAQLEAVLLAGSTDTAGLPDLILAPIHAWHERRATS